jgi:hypothetical protein
MGPPGRDRSESAADAAEKRIEVELMVEGEEILQAADRAT